MLPALRRNVTIAGKPGSLPVLDMAFTKPGSLPVLDMAFTNELLELCPTCWLTIKGVVLSRARRGSGDGVQAITGSEQLGAVLLLQDVIRQRIACVPAADAAAVVDETPRSALVPGITSQRQSTQLSMSSMEHKVSRRQPGVSLRSVAWQQLRIVACQ
jgi:hypothetical protein